MNARSLKRLLGSWAIITGNRLRGRVFAPHPRATIFIENTSFCNLLCRFCSYRKAVRPRAVVDEALFSEVVAQAAAARFRHVWLTPQTGDVFLDKHFVPKVQALENSPIPSTGFYTNLIGASREHLDALAAMTKLRELHVSLYGEDQAHFAAVTARPAAQFDRLLENLDALSANPAWRNRVVLSLRTGRRFQKENWRGPLAERVARLCSELGATFDCETDYDSWGGLISNDEVADLGIEILNGGDYYKRGACIRALGAVQVMVDGSVNACACRDPRGALRIGDVRSAPLEWIVSGRNKAYADLINGMNRGIFPRPCTQCSVYRSVYDHRWAAHAPAGSVVPLSDFWDLAEP